MGQKDKLTISHHEKINSQNGKSFSGLVVRVLEFALHDCSVYLYNDDAAQTSKYHSVEVALASHSLVLLFLQKLWSSYFLRPHWSVRKVVVIALERNATVPYTPARARICLEPIPRDLYKMAVWS